MAAHWTLDGGAGNIAVDIVGAHDGTLRGATWVVGGIRCDGFDDFVEIPAGPFKFDTWTELTVAAWVTNEIGANSRTNDIVSWWNYPASPGWLMTHHNDRKYFAEIGGRGNATGGVTSTARTHVAMTYRGNEGALRLHVNGVLVGTKTVVSGTLPSSNAQVRICGQQDNRNFFAGVIDDVKIWSRALTAKEIAALAGG